jgi:hypothetical protein
MAEPIRQDHATRTLSEDDFAVGIDDRYFEDYAMGAVYEYGYASVNEADIIAFAERFDPQPIHTDARFAASGPFGGLIASGWHTASLAMRAWSLTITCQEWRAWLPRAWTNCDGPHRCAQATHCGYGQRSWRHAGPEPSQTGAWSAPGQNCSTSTTRPCSASWP